VKKSVIFMLVLLCPPIAMAEHHRSAPQGKRQGMGSANIAAPRSEDVLRKGPFRLSLAEAETAALKRAPELARAALETQAGGQVVRESRSQLFPQISGDISAVGTLGSNTRIGALGGLNNPAIFNRESQGININQLIFDFGRTENLTAAAKFQELSEAQQEQVVRGDVLLHVDRAYFDVLKAQALLRVANETVAAREVAYAEADALVNSKLKSDLDLSYAQVNLEQAKQLVIQTENALGVAYSNLAEAMGSRTAEKFMLVDPPEAPLPNASVDSLIHTALQFRPEIVALRDQVSSADKRADAEREARFPKVEAIGSFGRTPLGDSAVQGNYGAAGLNVEIPLFTGGLLSSRQREAKLKASAELQSLEKEKNQVVNQVNSAWLDATTALKNIDVTTKLAASAEQALDLARAQYKAGTTSTIELSQAELNALQAEIEVAAAKYDYQIRRVNLDYNVGTLQLKNSSIGNNTSSVIVAPPAERLTSTALESPLRQSSR
jgi:outer membrane protein